jgi:hypothetical protein
MRSGLVLIAMLAATPESLARDLHVHEEAPGVVIMKISGVNTANALVLGRTTHRLARLYCERDPAGVTQQRGGSLTTGQCVTQTMRHRKPLRVVANCPERRIITTSTESFVLVSVENGQGLWNQNSLSADSSTYAPSPRREIDEQFKLLCPRFFSTPMTVASTTAHAQPKASHSDVAFLGEWDMFPSYCQRQDGQETRLRITDTSVEFHDVRCRIDGVTEIGDGRWQITGMCDAEGDDLTATYFLNVVGNRMIVLDGSEIGPKRIYHRCD